jgi:hypothetical protein
VQLVSVDHLPQLIKFAQSNMKYLNLFLILLIINSGLHAMQPDPPVSMQGDPQDAAVQNVCPICLIADLDAGNKDNPTFVLLCGHRFCRACITHWLARTNKCPICLHQFEHGLHWPLAGHNIDRVNVLNNIAMWGPSVSLAVCFSAILLLIVRKLTTG